ncbi:MAG TPA: M56 family metallopeptidase [Sedimentisphaerales bacterium]|nr:M56 family metallopeptidase [Sedimentisphaerales bacterium]
MNNILNLFANGIVNYLLFGSVVAALLTLLAWGIIRIAKIRAPIYRHMIWLYLLMGIVVLPAIWLGGPKLTLAVLPARVEPIKTEVPGMDTGTTVKLVENTPIETHLPSLTHTRMPVETNPGVRAFPIRAVLAGVWLVGVVFVLARLAVGWYQLRRIRLSTPPVSQNKLIANLDGQKLRILVTSRVRGPVCFGVLRPVILLPKEMYEKSTEEDLQMVLNHELAHIERRDCLTNLFQRIVEAAFFFHPLVLYASSQLTQQREQICDNYVLKKGVPVMDYIKLLSRIAEQGLEKTWFHAVALFEGRLAQRVRSLLDPKHSSQIKASRWATVVCAIAVLICLAFGTLRLEAKSKADISVGTAKTGQTDTESIDPKIRELGEAVRKRLTTYSDEKTLTLKDGRTGRMKIKQNITGVARILITPHIVEDGTKFDLEALDAADKAIEGTKTTSPVIHDAQTMRMGLGKSFSVDGEDIMSKIQLVPARQDDNSVVVEVKVLFTRMATPEEINAMLLTRGKDGRLQLNYSKISSWLMQYKQRTGHYPKNLEELNQPLPKDVYSPTGEDYRYEAQRSRFILSSCGEDGIYGNDDDEIFIAYQGGARSGQRHELYPLEEDEEVEAQTETVGPSGRRPKGNCSIGGKVISAETGEPIGHAKAYLFCLATHDAIFIDVASDGSFQFKNIPAGSYSLRTINTSEFQDAIYNPEGKYGQYPEFSLKDEEKRTDLLLKARPAYSISGRVLDEDGKIPESINTLHVLAWIEKDNGQGYENEQARLNRKDGSYFIDGLSGKPVYIMAINWRAAKEGNAHPPIYYPGTFSRNDAKLIRFDEKQECENIDIRLRRKGGLILEGTVTDDTGKPVPEAFVVVHRSDMLFDFVTDYTDKKGSYQIQGLGDGEFLVHVDAAHRELVRTRTPIVIDSANRRAQLDFALKRGVTISGKFVDEDGNDWQIGQSYGDANIKDWKGPTSSFSLTDFRNKYRTKDVRKGSGGSFQRGQGDYGSAEMLFPARNTFIVEGMMPGKTIISFSPKKEGCKVLEILYNGRDIMETGLETKPGREIKDVTIVIETP